MDGGQGGFLGGVPVSTVPEDIVGMLRRREDLGTISMAMVPPPTRETVKRCATVTAFDEELYEQVLRADDGPGLAELLEAGQIRETPESPGTYQLEPYLHSGGWSAWWTDEGKAPESVPVPSALARYARRLGNHYHQADKPLEELRALLLVDAAEATVLFRKLYEPEYRLFDLARAQDVIDVLAEPDRASLVPFELGRLRDDYQLFLSARNARAAEYHQSARYLSREEPESALLDLLGQSPGRVLQIVAPGGTGKTMQLRWCLARYCLAQLPPIPCAWIDFDFADPGETVRSPWLIALELANQLNAQIPGRPFNELLGDYGRYLPALHQTTEQERPDVDEGTAVDAEDVITRFCAAMNEKRQTGEPVVLFLDTMEEIVLRQSGSTAQFAELLHRICNEVPAARLVLSSRYDLSRRLRGFRARFGKVHTVKMTGFSPDEARRYLTQTRCITDDALLNAIVRKSDGLPFSLALFGDLVAQQPDLSPAEIEESSGPALLYCIARILERIDDDRLRWLLRYGVVPRQLRYGFLKDVIWPYLIQGIEGDDQYDDPARDARPDRPTRIFVPSADPPTDSRELRSLWDRLNEYASQSSWVSSSGLTLTFHPRVRVPLRNLLRAQPVFDILHRDAIAYYERGAGEPPGPHWARWMRDAVYHRFQLHQPEAADAWRAAVSRSRKEGRPDWAEELAADLFSPDYLNDLGEPDRTVIGDQVRYEAHVEVAWANAEAARAAQDPAGSARWKTAEDHAAAAAQLLAANAAAAGSSTRLPIVQASIALTRGDDQDSLTRMAALVTDGLADEERRDVLVLQAEIASLAGDESTSDRRFLDGFNASVDLGDNSTATLIAVDCAARHLADDQPFIALRWCDLASRVEGHPPWLAGRLAGTAASALLQLGLPTQAIRQVLPDGSARFVSEQAGDSAAEALLAMERPVDALRVLLQDPRLGAPVEASAWHRTILCGQAHGMLLRTQTASQVLQRGLRARQNDREAAALTTELVEVYLQAGDLEQAAYHLGNLQQYRVPPESPEWLDMRLAQMEVERNQRQPDAARLTLSAILQEFSETGTTRRRAARVAVNGLAAVADDDDRDKLLQILLNALDSPDLPPGTRLGMLHDLRHCQTIDGASAAARETLDSLVLRGWRQDGDGLPMSAEDRAWLDLAAVEVSRLLGRGHEAQATLDRAVEVLAAVDPLIWLEWLRASNRIGTPAQEQEEPPPTLLEQYRDYPAVCAAYLIELTERRVSVDPFVRLERRLDQAWKLLNQADYRYPGLQARHRELLGSLSGQAGGEAPEPANLSTGALPGSGLPLWPARQNEWVAEVRTRDVPGLGSITNPRLIEDLQEANWSVTSDGEILARVIGPGLAEAARGADPDIRLTLEAPAAVALPWEAAHILGQPVTGHRAFRFVYRGRGNGDREEAMFLLLILRRLGFLSESDVADVEQWPAARVITALHEMQRTSGLPESDRPDRRTWQRLRQALREIHWHRPHVVLLQQDAKRSIITHRGYHASEADPGNIYRGFGVRVTEVRNPTPERLRAWSPEQTALEPPDVVHICAAVETSERRPALNFGEPDPEEALTAAHIAAFAEGFGRTMPPLIVLDTLTPSTRSEEVRQLLVRNVFCEQLASLDVRGTVLGTGLADGFRRPGQLKVLARAVANGDSPARMWQALAQQVSDVGPMAGDETTPLFVPALFSNLPPDAMMGPGAW
jgi:hypothetical protein